MKIVRLMADYSPENPATAFDGQWSIYSFNSRHASYADPEKFFPDGKPAIGLRRKLAVGTAFLLDYFEHGNCVWSIAGTGPQCQWDNSRNAGLLVWEHPVKEMGAKTRADREKDAAAFLETYTCWCNGEVYGYEVLEIATLPCGHTETRPIDDASCWGYFGNDLDYMAECVREHVQGDSVQF
mgnify:FL=1